MRAWGVDAAEPIVTDPGAISANDHEPHRRARADARWRSQGSPLVIGSLFAIAAIGAALLFFVLQGGPLAGGWAPPEGQPRRSAAAQVEAASQAQNVKVTDAASASDLPR